MVVSRIKRASSVLDAEPAAQLFQLGGPIGVGSVPTQDRLERVARALSGRPDRRDHPAAAANDEGAVLMLDRIQHLREAAGGFRCRDLLHSPIRLSDFGGCCLLLTLLCRQAAEEQPG